MQILYIATKLLISLIFISSSVLMIFLCFKANDIKERFADLETLIKEDFQRFYETSTIAAKLVIELIFKRNAFDLTKFL